ncbi:hypothetical protein DV738_g3886, partial [Chaetothyriales sp. CBS 135597]
MRVSLSHLGLVLLASTLGQAFSEHARRAFTRGERARSRHQDRRAGLPSQAAPLVKRDTSFLTPKSKPFVVNGTGIPEVPFDIGESYAGLLPISDKANETRQLFFWFFPSINPDAGEEVLIWFNGGPGCSSLSGLLTENGPFLWQAGTLSPIPNSYSWTNLTNVVWVEQPVGVGYTQGIPDISDEVELAREFIGFWKNFISTFDLQGWTTYITGESYAGYYVPYVADAFITAADDTYYKLGGVAINDPILGDSTIQQEVVILPFVEQWKDIFYLNESYYNALWGTHNYCNFSTYLDTYFTFPPPPGPFPTLPDPFADESGNYTCDVFDWVYAAALEVNPCFNIYHITDTCPFPYSQLGIVNTGDYKPPGAVVYFNRTDVKQALNAPLDSNWEQCSSINVFGDGDPDSQTRYDQSPGPAQNGVLQRVIEHTNNTIIGVGHLDFILAPNGTLFTLQNVTWNGKQGFQTYPQQKEFFVPYHPEYNLGRLSEAGYVGHWGHERGLTYYTVQLSGHELPGYAAGSGYRVVELLLGRIKSLGTIENFSTQKGDFGNDPSIGQQWSQW